MVIAVIALMAAIVLPQFGRTRENQVLKSGVEDILSSIDKARGRTLSSVDSSEYGVHFQSDKVIIFKGTVYSESDPNNESISIVSPAAISNVTLNGSSGTSGNLYFNRLSGTPSKTGTVTIATANFSKVITISATGTASAN